MDLPTAYDLHRGISSYEKSLPDLMNAWLDMIIDLGSEGKISEASAGTFSRIYHGIKEAHKKDIKEAVVHGSNSDNPYKMRYILSEQIDVLRYTPIIVDSLKSMGSFLGKSERADDLRVVLSSCIEEYSKFPDPMRINKIKNIQFDKALSRYLKNLLRNVVDSRKSNDFHSARKNLDMARRTLFVHYTTKDYVKDSQKKAYCREYLMTLKKMFKETAKERNKPEAVGLLREMKSFIELPQHHDYVPPEYKDEDFFERLAEKAGMHIDY